MMTSSQIFLATVAVAALSFAGLVSAQEATQPAWPDSTLSRTEVMADLAQAKRDGSIKVRSITYGQPAASTMSREDVRRALAQAQQDGSINVSSITYGQPAHSSMSREQVRAERAAAAHASAAMARRNAY